MVERPRGARSKAASGACGRATSGACRSGPGACPWAGLASRAGSVSGLVWAWPQGGGVTSGGVQSWAELGKAQLG